MIFASGISGFIFFVTVRALTWHGQLGRDLDVFFTGEVARATSSARFSRNMEKDHKRLR
jgi:hypothetical protein